MAFRWYDMLPEESVTLTVQHLDMLACNETLSEKTRNVCSNASMYLQKLVLEQDEKEVLKPVTDPRLNAFFGCCPVCNKPVSAIQQPHFCGHCGCHIEWEGWEEGS